MRIGINVTKNGTRMTRGQSKFRLGRQYFLEKGIFGPWYMVCSMVTIKQN